MEYLSSSRLSLFDSCGLAFKFKYLDRSSYKDETVDFYADYGSLLHDLFERLAKKEISQFQAEREYDEKFNKCGIPTEQKPNYYMCGKKSIDQKVTEFNELNIVGIEKDFKVNFDFSSPPLYGFIDLIHKTDRGYVVRDYKSSKPYSDSDIKKLWQPIIYSLACKELYGEYPYMFEYDFFRFDEIKTVLIDERFMKMGLIRLKGQWNKIKNSNYEGNYNPFWCNSFCQHRSVCPVYSMKVGAN